MWPVADEDILTEELLNPIGMYKVSQKYHLYIALSLDLKEFLVAMKVFVIVILSVCLSVHLSVTLVDCVHTVRPTIMISSPYGSPIILVSWDITFIQKFEGGHPEQGR